MGRTGTNYARHFETAIARLKWENRYRVFANLERDAARFPIALWRPEDPAEAPREVTIWCSNDYLGMGGHDKPLNAAIDAARRHGAGAGGTRNISGTHNPIVQLEAELADLHGKPAALVFTSGWISNLAGISTIASLLPDCLILSDALNHNSMIEGVRRANCAKQIWRHNDRRASGRVADRGRPRSRQTDRVREPLFDGRRHRAGRRDRRPRREVQRDDLYRRGSRGRHVRRARRRHLRARRRDGPHRHHRGHARQGFRRARRLYRGTCRDRRRGAQLCPAIHLHDDASADGRRERLRGGAPPEGFRRGARAPSAHGRADQTCAARGGPAGDGQSLAYRPGDGRRGAGLQGGERSA